MKAIAGCKSDEVPGIAGVGEKTAIKFLKNELPKHFKAYSKIRDNWESALEKWLPLVHLPLEGTPLPNLHDYKHPSMSEFFKICVEYEFESFLRGTEREKWVNFIGMQA